MISTKLGPAIRDIPDFPKSGIIFKDITPILKNPELCSEIIEVFAAELKDIAIDAVAGIESRGFLFGLMLANRLSVPFIPIRKAGKLPYHTIKEEYDLEYGSAIIEMHKDAFEPGQRILIHDDLLATGGTVEAASRLIMQLGGEIAAYCFIVSLGFLNGKERLNPFSRRLISLMDYH